MQKDDLKHLIVAIIAIVAMILAVFAIAVPEDEEDDGDEEGISNVSPTANISVTNTTFEETTTVNFDASGSTDSDGSILEYTWDFGDGVKDCGMYSDHAYSIAGSYSVTLTVVDNDGASDVVTVNITIIEKVEPTNSPPAASFTVSENSVEVYTSITFNGSLSTDSDGAIVEYTWDFGDGIKSSGMYTNHYYSSIGTFTAILTVADNQGATDSSSVQITVSEGGGTPTNNPPDAALYASETSIVVEDSIDFNASESSDSDGTIVEYTWDFGDGTHDSGMRVAHTYLDYDTFNVTLSVIDDDGAKDTRVITITVTPETPKGFLQFEEVEFGKFEGYFVDEFSNPTYFSELEMIIFDDSLSQSASQDPMNPGVTLQILGGMNCTYDDEDSNGMINEHETITIYEGDLNDTIRFIYKPTGGIIAEYTLLSNTPYGAMDFTETTPGNFTGSIISLSKSTLILRVNMTIIDDSLGQSASQEPIDPGVTLQVPGGINSTYSDNNLNGKIDAGDDITISGTAKDDILRFVYIPTGGTIATFIVP
jgi:PKD repeat protein